MTAIIRPFDLPVPRGAAPPTGLGLVETPSPTLGAIVCASSTFNAQGRNVGAVDGPMGIVGRIALSSILAVLAGGLIDYVLAGALPSSVTDTLGSAVAIPGLICGVIVFALCFKRFGQGKPRGECLYAGVDGVERITLEGGMTTRVSVRYLDDLFVTRGQSTISVNGTYRHDSDLVRFYDTSGRHLMTVFAMYHKDSVPGAELLLVREVAGLAAHRRAESAHARLAKGDVVTFPILVAMNGGFGLGPRRLELRGDTLELHDANATPSLKQRFARSAVTMRVRQGQFEIIPKNALEAGIGFDRQHVGDSEVLLALQQPG